MATFGQIQSNLALTAGATLRRNAGDTDFEAVVLGTLATQNGTFSGTSSGTNTGDQTTVSGNAGTATALQNTRTIWGQNFNGTANVTGTLALGTADLTMTGSIGATGARVTKGWFTDLEVTNAIVGSITGNAATVSSANEATDTTCFILFITASGTQTLATKNNTGLTYNSNTNAVGATTFVGALTGNATTASTLATPRNIGGVAFDGSAAIVPQTIESANEAADTTCFVLFITASGTQQLQPKNNTGFTYNASTNAVGATTFVGALSGNATTATNVAVGGITGLGTGVATALAVNVGSAGAFVTFNGALGTPSSGTVTNLTGTASININGTVGATTPTTATFTTATINTVLNPDADGGAGLGSATLGFSILGLSSGSTINFANSNVVLTHSSGILTIGTGTLKITTPTNNTTSVVTVDATQTLSNKTFSSNILLNANGTIDIGDTTNGIDDIFFSSGSVLNFNNGNATITHSASLFTSNVDIVVPDEAYGGSWDGSLEVPTKNAVYDKIQTLAADYSYLVGDGGYF